MKFTEGAYLSEDGVLTLPNEDYFILTKLLIDGLADISDGFTGPTLQMTIDQEKGVATMVVGVHEKKFARKYKCRVSTNGNFEFKS